MLWPWKKPIVKNHECTPIPIEEPHIELRYIPMENYAAYDKYHHIRKNSECPICNVRYPYGETNIKHVGVVSLLDVININKINKRGG